MSNQQYRKEPQEPPSREARLVAARARIEAERAKGKSFDKGLNELLAKQYLDQGGREIDSQIEGMMLVIDEAKIYRRQMIAYHNQMDDWLAGRREREPYAPEKAAISGATMVSASRQLEVLREKRTKLKEDLEIRMAAGLDAYYEKRAKSKPDEGSTPQEPPPKEPPAQPPTDKEQAPVKKGDRAATAAA